MRACDRPCVRACVRACVPGLPRSKAPLPQHPPRRLLSEPLRSSFTPEFMATLMSNGELVRHVALVGALHHGKTTIMDMLVEQVGFWGGEGGGML